MNGFKHFIIQNVCKMTTAAKNKSTQTYRVSLQIKFCTRHDPAEVRESVGVAVDQY